MLVLSRKRDEQIVIDDVIVLTVVDVRGDTVRLGVDAPRSIAVHRREVYDAIAREKAAQLPAAAEEPPDQQREPAA